MTGLDHPAMTVPQFITILDRLCQVGCCTRKKKRDGQTIYSLSLNDIAEGYIILAGDYSVEDAPRRGEAE